MFNKEIRGSLLALFLISLGGWLLHFRIHPPAADADNLVPAIFGVVSILVVPVLFSQKRTVAWAYILNVAAVAVGTVAMALWSVNNWQGPVTWQAVLLKSTLADILILFAKLPLGHHILRHFRPAGGPSA